MTTQLPAVALGVVCLCSATPSFRQTSAHRLPTVRVDAGQVDRVDCVVSFALPPFVIGDFLQLRPEGVEDGPAIPVQIDKDRRAWFVLDALNAGDARRYTIEPTLDRREQFRRVDVLSERDGLTLRVLQQPVLRYQADRSEPPRPDIRPTYRRGGYLHPVRAPSGRIVSDDYPPAHLHHHGIWAAWAKTVFQGRTPDFWSMGEGTGSVEFESLIDTWSGGVQAGFKARHRYVDLTAPAPTTVLTETWEITLYGVGVSGGAGGTGSGSSSVGAGGTGSGSGSGSGSAAGANASADDGTAEARDASAAGSRDAKAARSEYRLFDLVLTQELVTSSPLALPEFLYGGVAFQGARSWDGPNGARIVTSEGKTRANGDSKPARWCYIGGPVGGGVGGPFAGLAMLSHPANVHAPQPLRLYPNEPFLNFAPTRAGRLDLTPGRPYVARYRFVTLDGAPNVALIERLWRDYAEPVDVEVLPGAPTTP